MQWDMQELEKWEELQAFVDTALLPLYLYRPDEPIDRHVWRMTYLMQVAAAIEQRLRGRVLLFPLAYHVGETPVPQQMPRGFAHYAAIQFAGDRIPLKSDGAQSHPLYLTVGDEDLTSSLRFEVTVDVLYQEILRKWQSSRQ